ncbi:MAG: tryptophan 7-halogenase [Chloroflexota bacterium]
MSLTRDVEPHSVDVVVVGHGPAGTAAALTLAQMGASVLVVDRSIPRPILGEGLPPGTSPVLESLGLWDQFLRGGHQPAHGNRSAWGGSTLREYDFIRDPYGVGWHLDRSLFDSMLTTALAGTQGVVCSGTRVVTCRRERDGRWCLGLASDRSRREVRTEFLIDASGRARQIARTLGRRRRVYDRLIGNIGILRPAEHASDTDSFTLVEAVPDGWWYATTLSDSRMVVGYMTDTDPVARTNGRTTDSWMTLLGQTEHIQERVARYGYTLECAPRRVCADSSRLDTMAGNGWCAAGDSAAAHDPLSSHGITSALIAGIRAGHAIADAPRGGIVEYEEYMQHAYARYRAQWMAYYTLEQRWPEAPFWHRRHAALRNLF